MNNVQRQNELCGAYEDECQHACEDVNHAILMIMKIRFMIMKIWICQS